MGVFGKRREGVRVERSHVWRSLVFDLDLSAEQANRERSS